MKWFQDLVKPHSRQWEEFYRNRWQHDKIVRSTHGVNCTGSCSWDVYIKDGIITWEMQATDYPLLKSNIPPYEPRGCPRGISASWYVYSPLRVKYPYIRGILLDLWREARKNYSNPLEAWASIVNDEDKRKRYQTMRGKGGFRRFQWNEALELISASCLYTTKKWGPDRIFGFSPIPAMSYISYAAGTRFLQLLGGVASSFYDWYSDLPPALPETWGEQTDVAESADWFNSRYIVIMGSNVSVTRAPDSHFIHEARHIGTKLVDCSPEYSPDTKIADWWIPIQAGRDHSMWMAINHVILKEFFVDRQVPYFIQYLKQYSDTPFLIKLIKTENGYEPEQFLRASDISDFQAIENAEWKILIYDDKSKQLKVPKGTIGFRWGKEYAKWNLKLEDAIDNQPIDPLLTFIEQKDTIIEVAFQIFTDNSYIRRGVPIKYIETNNGRILVATVFDILMANFGVNRGLSGDYPINYDDNKPYSPAWQEHFSGIGRKTVIRLAREFAHNAEITQGRSMVIIGTGINHWYHNNLAYRGPITALILCGCVGVNGGGLNHYVGQEKVALIAPWTAVAFGLDWNRSTRLQQTPIWHYVHSDQWRYEGSYTEYNAVPNKVKDENGHVIDEIARAVRMGWMPFFPQFNKNTLDLIKEAEKDGAKSDQDIVQWIVQQLKTKSIHFAIEDPDAKENWPRVWFIWRANAIMASAKGHEYFLKHYLRATDNIIASEHRAKEFLKDILWREEAPKGKMDLVIDLNFRMDTSSLYSDIILPAAMWYEKNDLNTTDMHTFIHPLGEAVPPAWEAKSDWQIFKELSLKVSQIAKDYFPDPIRDIISLPLRHDTPDELAQPKILDWSKGECDPIPGKTMPHLQVITRDYVNLYNRFISFGPVAREQGLSVHGITIPIKEFYDDLSHRPIGGSPDSKHMHSYAWNGERYPSLEDNLDVANLILYLAPETNGELAYLSYKEEEKKTGVPLADLAETSRSVRVNFEDISTQPRRILSSPCWSGIVNDGRPYTGYAINIDRLVPWRTLTGRQQLYLDHPYYIKFGENLPTFKPKLGLGNIGDIISSQDKGKTIKLNFMTPHGKWQIHSTFYDNHRMRALSRSVEPCWMHPDDAAQIDVKDNDWVEIYNDNGVAITRAAVSARIQKGGCMIHHSAERTIGIPKSQIRGGHRSGVHNSLIRTRLNPVLLAGGYAQFTYFFNYWWPTGVNRDTYVIIRKLDKLEW